MAKNKNRKQPQQSQPERAGAREQEQQDGAMERQGSPADVARKNKKSSFGHN
ncbi:MAG TPA: hypothetical protein VFH77_01315 [Streptomyces sp.]|jgi:hypothetical protein|nr:hypothetical protein [Streptomyces sp.]